MTEDDYQYDSVMLAIFPKLYEAPQVEGEKVNQFGIDTRMHQRWRDGEESVRRAAVDTAINNYLDIKLAGTTQIDIAREWRKRYPTESAFNQAVLEETTDNVAKGLVIVEQFGETGKLMLQEAVAANMQAFLHQIDDEPPF